MLKRVYEKENARTIETIAYFFVVLLKECQFLIQTFYLHFQVGPGQSQFIQDPTQAINVRFDSLAKSHFVLESEKKPDICLLIMQRYVWRRELVLSLHNTLAISESVQKNSLIRNNPFTSHILTTHACFSDSDIIVLFLFLLLPKIVNLRFLLSASDLFFLIYLFLVLKDILSNC